MMYLSVSFYCVTKSLNIYKTGSNFIYYNEGILLSGLPRGLFSVGKNLKAAPALDIAMKLVVDTSRDRLCFLKIQPVS